MRETCFALCLVLSVLSVRAQVCRSVQFNVQGDNAIKGEIIEYPLPDNSIRVSFMNGLHQSNVEVQLDYVNVYSGVISSDTIFGTGRALTKIFSIDETSILSIYIDGQLIEHNLLPNYSFITIPS